jgi:RNA ligase (TIGR02306 family)
MGVDTHKAEVVSITLEKHPNADLLSVVRVYNFTVVVATESWLGVEKAVYIQPDSVMPDVPEYRYLKETQSLRKKKEDIHHQVTDGKIDSATAFQMLGEVEKEIDANTKYLRITVRKLRGVISMGMLAKCPEGAEIGDDVAERLSITHYEPPTVEEQEGSRRHTGDDVAPAPPMIYAPKYDVESVYKFADCFEKGEPVYVTEKIDGQNGRFVASDNGNPKVVETSPGGLVKSTWAVTLHAGSRTEWKKKEGNSNWWKVIEQNPWIERWAYDNQDSVMYGEVCGWVQNLKYGAKQGQLWFRAFDILNGTEYVNAEPFVAALPKEHRVPSLGIMPFDFEALQKLADGPSLMPGANCIREGIVIKPLKERQHWKLGRVMVKMVSNAYLEKSSR